MQCIPSRPALVNPLPVALVNVLRGDDISAVGGVRKGWRRGARKRGARDRRRIAAGQGGQGQEGQVERRVRPHRLHHEPVNEDKQEWQLGNANRRQ